MNSKITSDDIGPFTVGDIVFNHTTMNHEIVISMDNEQPYFTIRPLRWYDRLHIKAKKIWSYLRKKVMQMNSKCGKGGKKGGKGK